MRIQNRSLVTAAIAVLSAFSANQVAAQVYGGAPGYQNQSAGYPGMPGYTMPNPNMEYIAPSAPPAPLQEMIIAAPGPGYAWVPGFWHWQNGWVWLPGHWAMPPRPGLNWYGPNWVPHREGEWREHEEREEGRWRMEHGGWR